MKPYTLTLPGAAMWSRVIGRGKVLRLTDLEGRANVGMLLYNALEKQERYNMPDTLKGQHIFYLTHPYCLHSDMGRLFASIIEDTHGWHDTVCGCSDPESVAAKYGHRPYQEARNEAFKDARSCFLVELAKWGLGKRDLVPNLNWFSKVVSGPEGELHYDSSARRPGATVCLRLEMDTLVVLNTCQHPFDPDPEYRPGPVRLEVCDADPFDPATDPSLTSRPENQRAWENTTDYHSLRF